MPKPQVRWLKQGVEIIQSQEYQIEEMEDGTSILIIPEVYQDDTGEIVFEAYNPLGVTSTIAALSVESKKFNLFFKNDILFIYYLKFSVLPVSTVFVGVIMYHHYVPFTLLFPILSYKYLQYLQYLH